MVDTSRALIPTINDQGFRDLFPGMGQAVAERTILRRVRRCPHASCGELSYGVKRQKKDEPTLQRWLCRGAPSHAFETILGDAGERWEQWNEVADRVAWGNARLGQTEIEQLQEAEALKDHISRGMNLMSGRHLQHGDWSQPKRSAEVFTNCATSPTSFLSFLLLLSGSGVGRSYDDDFMLVNWDYAPSIRCVLNTHHADFEWDAGMESQREAKHKYAQSRDVIWFDVPDDREGWAKALEMWENAAFQQIHQGKLLVLDFSGVRPKGSPIEGMQGRPSSGPVPLMNAFLKAATIRGAGLPRWLQALYVDHYFAECVLVGGARRAARMATKWWRDESVIDFVNIKRPIEFNVLQHADIAEYRDDLDAPLQGFLWSANNSVTVDAEFWALLDLQPGDKKYDSKFARHARAVFEVVTKCSYHDATGEPGFINVDRLVRNDEGWSDLLKGEWCGSQRYELNEDSLLFMARLAKRAGKKQYNMIVNPCSEVCLTLIGGFCTLADMVPFHANTLEEAEESFRVAARALIRVNTMDSIYSAEVRRTNRIGVGLTGIHEFAWKFFGFGFRDLLDEEQSKPFWLALARFRRAVGEESVRYSKEHRLPTPHTDTTIKPSGSVSKLFGLTEGAHLPAMRFFLRWVQFRHDDPLVQEYAARGYPTRKLIQYEGTTIVGFPTAPVITMIGLGDKLVTAAEATPAEQYTWLRLLEKYWIHGTDEHATPLPENRGAQVSYTLKYDPKAVSYEEFSAMVREHQRHIRCCAVMPQVDVTSHEYQPEEPIDEESYRQLLLGIDGGAYALPEGIDAVHVDCDTGVCPVNFREGDAAEQAEAEMADASG